MSQDCFVHGFDHNPATAAFVFGPPIPILFVLVCFHSFFILSPFFRPHPLHGLPLYPPSQLVVFFVVKSSVLSTGWAHPVSNHRHSFWVFTVLQFCLKPLLDVPFSQLTPVRLSPLLSKVGTDASLSSSSFLGAFPSPPLRLLPCLFVHLSSSCPPTAQYAPPVLPANNKGNRRTSFHPTWLYLQPPSLIVLQPSFCIPSLHLTPPYPTRRIRCDDPTNVSILSCWWDPSSQHALFHFSSATCSSKNVLLAMLQRLEHVGPP